MISSGRAAREWARLARPILEELAVDAGGGPVDVVRKHVDRAFPELDRSARRQLAEALSRGEHPSLTALMQPPTSIS